jgi:lytic murein transglycosylase
VTPPRGLDRATLIVRLGGDAKGRSIMTIRFKVGGAMIAALLNLTVGAGPVLAQCGDGAAGFSAWLRSFEQEAAAAGISPGTLAALDGVAYDHKVINADRRQGVFAQSFLEFASRMVADYRMSQGKSLIGKHADTFQRIESTYGVPAPVIVAFWGLETDFGANLGDFRTLQSLATLAYDCRRPDQFGPELIAALKLLDNGDLALRDMKGAWAGELGQMQFVPTYYLDLAVDYDGDGKRNLVRSVPDVLASSANLLKHHGWRAGEPWLEEVRVPDELPWAEADLAIKHTLSEWAAWGVQKADGGPLASDGAQASLLLPMGRLGPAFLAYPNFDVYTQWNQSLVYATTAAYFATRLAGAPRLRAGNATPPSREQVQEAQQLLQKLGYDVGKADGVIGAKTRAAVKAVQQQLGLPADSYPDPTFLTALRRM